MTACIALPPLEDADLLMVLDGVAPPPLVEHLARCAACAACARDLMGQQAALRARLDRVACPPPVELGEYRLGLLAASAAAKITAHLAVCSRCSAELVELDAFLAATAASLEPGPLERVAAGLRKLPARLVSGLDGLTPAPAYAALRGEAGEPRIYEVEGWQIALEVVPDATEPSSLSILGLVTGPADIARAAVTLIQDDEAVAVEAVDAVGNFVLEGLPSGRYELAIDLPAVGVTIQIAALSV